MRREKFIAFFLTLVVLACSLAAPASAAGTAASSATLEIGLNVMQVPLRAVSGFGGSTAYFVVTITDTGSTGSHAYTAKIYKFSAPVTNGEDCSYTVYSTKEYLTFAGVYEETEWTYEDLEGNCYMGSAGDIYYTSFDLYDSDGNLLRASDVAEGEKPDYEVEWPNSDISFVDAIEMGLQAIHELFSAVISFIGGQIGDLVSNITNFFKLIGNSASDLFGLFDDENGVFKEATGFFGFMTGLWDCIPVVVHQVVYFSFACVLFFAAFKVFL